MYVLRGVLSVLITTVSLKGDDYIPIPPTLESLDSIEMVLNIPIAADAFFDYLEEQE